MNNPETWKRFSDPMIAPDGRSIWMKVETTGQTFDIAIPIDEIGDAVQFLARCSEFVVSNSDHANDETPPLLQRQEWAPIPARGFGVAAGHSPDESLIVIQLSCCQLAFPISGMDLVRLADDFVRTARTLSAGRGEPN